jgi:hypothetical protein
MVVKKVGIDAKEHKPIEVRITYETIKQSEGSCLRFIFRIQGIHRYALMIHLKGCDMVFDVYWLKGLRPIL